MLISLLYLGISGAQNTLFHTPNQFGYQHVSTAADDEGEGSKKLSKRQKKRRKAAARAKARKEGTQEDTSADDEDKDEGKESKHHGHHEHGSSGTDSEGEGEDAESSHHKHHKRHKRHHKDGEGSEDERGISSSHAHAGHNTLQAAKRIEDDLSDRGYNKNYINYHGTGTGSDSNIDRLRKDFDRTIFGVDKRTFDISAPKDTNLLIQHVAAVVQSISDPYVALNVLLVYMVTLFRDNDLKKAFVRRFAGSLLDANPGGKKWKFKTFDTGIAITWTKILRHMEPATEEYVREVLDFFRGAASPHLAVR